MKKPLPDHGFKAGDEVCFYILSGSSEKPLWISTITRTTKALIETPRCKLDWRHYKDRRIRLATNEDREYLQRQEAEKDRASSLREERDRQLNELMDLFGEPRPHITSGNVRESFDVEFYSLSIEQIKILAAKLTAS